MAEPVQQPASERDDPRLRVRMVDLVVTMTEAAGSNRRLADGAGVSETTVRNFKRGSFPRDSSEMGRRLDVWATGALVDHPGVGARGSLQDLLERWQGAEAAEAGDPAPTTPVHSRRRVALLTGGLVVVLAVGALVGWRVLGHDASTISATEVAGVAGVRVDAGLVLDDDNFCTWRLEKNPIPLASLDPLVMRVDARCSFPAEIDPAKDAGSSVFDAPDNDTATKTGVIRSGNTFEPLCFVESGDEVSDGDEPANTSAIWIRSKSPEGYLPDVNVGGGYTAEQLLTLGVTRCVLPAD